MNHQHYHAACMRILFWNKWNEIWITFLLNLPSYDKKFSYNTNTLLQVLMITCKGWFHSVLIHSSVSHCSHVPQKDNGSLLLPTFFTYNQQNLPLDVKRAWDYQMRKEGICSYKKSKHPKCISWEIESHCEWHIDTPMYEL